MLSKLTNIHTFKHCGWQQCGDKLTARPPTGNNPPCIWGLGWNFQMDCREQPLVHPFLKVQNVVFNYFQGCVSKNDVALLYSTLPRLSLKLLYLIGLCLHCQRLNWKQLHSNSVYYIYRKRMAQIQTFCQFVQECRNVFFSAGLL